MTAPSGLPTIRACLFDMDGLLIDSEDLYTLCTNKVLHEYGKPDLPWNIKAQLQGRPGPEAGRILQEWAQLPISKEEFEAKTRALQADIFPTTQPLPGIVDLVANLRSAAKNGLQVALATSSHRGNFERKSGHLQDLFSVFPEPQRVLGDDPRIPKGRGKPAPDIYLLALKTINDQSKLDGGKEIHPEECLVFEDSVPGAESGRRAGMQVVWCPHPGLLNEYKGREKEVLAGLTGEHKEDEGQELAAQVKDDVKGKEERTHARIQGQPGEIDDGWARLYNSLEDFPFDYYGINIGHASN